MKFFVLLLRYGDSKNRLEMFGIRGALFRRTNIMRSLAGRRTITGHFAPVDKLIPITFLIISKIGGRQADKVEASPR